MASELGALPPATPTPSNPSGSAAPTRRADGPTFSDALGKLGHEIDQGEKLLKKALGAGRNALSAGDLIALQAGIYRYSEAVDLTGKLVDRAGSAIKTTLRGNG